MADDTKRFDGSALLAKLEPQRRPSAFNDWLDADPERTAAFWTLMDGAATMRIGLHKALALWDSEYPDHPCPVKYNQVRQALRDREAKRAG